VQGVSAKPFILRPYAAGDEDASIELWRRTWQEAYPHIDFATRTGWWRTRWRDELVPQATITVAESKVGMVGYVTVDPNCGYMDQIVVAPEMWGGSLGSALLDEAKRISPKRVDLLVNKDNARAIRFYEKHGFEYAGEDVNPVSGKAVNKMQWRPR
jgi:putative acetyltransferase